MSLVCGLKNLICGLKNKAFPVTAHGWPGCDLRLPGGIGLHLVGSVHMGTPDMAPLPAGLLEKLQQADGLIVEADVLHGKQLPDTPPCAPLQTRLAPALYQQLAQQARQLGIEAATLEDKPGWLVALTLQAHQAQQLGFSACYGIDYQLLRAADEAKKTVLELEGQQRQLALLAQLTDNGLSLLENALQYWRDNARLLQLMAGWWSGVAPVRPNRELPTVFSDELHQVLLFERNRQWRDFLRALPGGNYVVAVGALHLYGGDSLIRLLMESE